MTDENNKIITYCDSFVGDNFDVEYFGNFMTDAINSRLYELMETTNNCIKPSKDEFEALMYNIDNFKILMDLLVEKRFKELEERHQQIEFSN
jgi:hypothetical protein